MTEDCKLRPCADVETSGTCRRHPSSLSHFLAALFSFFNLFDPVRWRFSNPAKKKHWQMALGMIRSSLAHLQTPHTHLQNCIPVPTPSFPLSRPLCVSRQPLLPPFLILIFIVCYQIFRVLQQNLRAMNKMHCNFFFYHCLKSSWNHYPNLSLSTGHECIFHTFFPLFWSLFCLCSLFC